MGTQRSVEAPGQFSFQPKEWPAWKRRYVAYHTLTKLGDESEDFQICSLMYVMGNRSYELLSTFNLSDEDLKKYKEVFDAFEKHFVGKKNVVYERAIFNSRNQQQGESIEDYVTVMYTLSEHCDYGTIREDLIRDRIVLGVLDKGLSQKLMLDSPNLQKAVEISRRFEPVKRDHAEISGEKPKQVVDRVQMPQGKRNHLGRKDNTVGKTKPEETSKSVCYLYGREGHRSTDKEKCPATNSVCFECKEPGHFSKMCRNKSVHIVEESSPVKSFFAVSTEDERKKRWEAEIVVNQSPIIFKLDSGADAIILPYYNWRKDLPGQKLKITSVILQGPNGARLDCVGMFEAELYYKRRRIREEVYVVKGVSTPLLSLSACEDLGLLRRLFEIASPVNPKAEFPSLFTGLGTMDQEYDIKLRNGAVPYAVSCSRRVPLPLMSKLKEELETMKKNNVIEEIDEPTDWCAPLVVAPKSNGKIRICVDLERLNENVQREYHMLPVVEHELAKLTNARIFSKLDANWGFWQIRLSERSAKLTTFITPFGRFYFKRLPFGITSAPEVFQKMMSDILRGIYGVICLMDDILIFGGDQAEHDSRLRKVLDRLSKRGITLNPEKCEFGMKRVRFLGHVVDETGIHPDEEKLKAIMELEEPKNVSDVRSLLGFLNYLAKFIPDMSTVLQPLSVLLRSDSVWTWGKPQKQAFAKIKEILSSDPLLAKYDTNKDTMVSSDSSSYGLGAVLKQKQKNDVWKPVWFASRTLTDTEKRYAQIEKEALAITWACDRFRDFIVGRDFHVETDHKPLLAIFKTKDLAELTPRLQRFRMRMMAYSFTISHTPGKELVAADYLSRYPLNSEEKYDLEEETVEHVRMVINNIETTDDRLKEIAVGQKEILTEVTRFTLDGWPEKKRVKQELRSYFEVRDEISYCGGRLMRGSRLIIPSSLRNGVLMKIHEGHLGATKCKNRAREVVYWPVYTVDIEEMIRRCEVCAEERNAIHQPLIPSEFPDRPWQKLGMDLFYKKEKWYLLVCDYYSRYPEIALLPSLRMEVVIDKLKMIFATHGVPEKLYSDNGTQFSVRASSEFQSFAAEYGFKHRTSSPKFPQANGFAENAVKIVKRALTKNEDWSKARLKYRRIRTTFPCSPSLLEPKAVNKEELLHWENERRMKQKIHYDRRHRAVEKDVSVGEKVWVKDRREWGVVTKKAYSPRSFWVKTPSGEFRRNEFHLEPVGVLMQEEDFDYFAANSDEEDIRDRFQKPAEQRGSPSRPRNRNASRYGWPYVPVSRLVEEV